MMLMRINFQICRVREKTAKMKFDAILFKLFSVTII